ncbi:hypothetical protein [Paracoccus sp. (in: a-proteobacteria)]|uniref:hypothetical protein n=1 Tax=Paracoccus sp. TaxID=267 RepID=UPI002B001B55|nr:hypothetical protein [Paracoccus sp. (in: a-proteobacteria)]
MMTSDITNPRWSSDTSVDVIWNHPDLSPRFGPLPYTVVDGSGEPEMQAIWDGLMRGDFGLIGNAEDRP